MGTINEDIAASADWIARALTSSGYRADFSPQSLWEVDRFFDENSRDGVAKSGGLLAKDLGARVFAIGSYIGEVVRRGVGGEWVGDDSDPEAEITVELRLPDGTRCWPFQRAMRRFKNGPEDGIAVWAMVPVWRSDHAQSRRRAFSRGCLDDEQARRRVLPSGRRDWQSVGSVNLSAFVVAGRQFPKVVAIAEWLAAFCGYEPMSLLPK